MLAMMLAAACVTGKPWLGMDVAPGPAVYFSCEEDRGELHRRLDAIRADMGLEFDELHELRIMCMYGRETALAEFDRSGAIRPTPTFGALEEFALDVAPALLVLDTIADTFGGNEIDRLHVRQFVAMLRGLALRCNTTLLTLSHPSLTGMATGAGTSGSTAWSNSVRSRLYLSHTADKDESGTSLDPDARILQTKKSNYGPIGSTTKLRWSRGVFVLDQATSSRALFDEAIFLSMLSAYEAEGRNVSASPSLNYAPKVFAADARSQRTGKAALAAAMNSLLAKQEIKIVSYGRPSRPAHKLAIA